jgi:dihydroorotate dehydrogenase electron transfer subunit
MINNEREHRDTLFVEDAEVLSVEAFSGAQYILRLHSPKCAKHASAGSFIHLQCDESIPMRRPISIMRASANEGWIEILLKIVGAGLGSLAHKQPGDKLSSIGPIGHGFEPTRKRKRPLLIGGGVGIPPMIFLADTLRKDDRQWQPLLIMGSEIPFPFECIETAINCDWVSQDICATMPLLEEWGIPAKLASLSDFAGTYRGYVTDVADQYLASLNDVELRETEIFSCGPTPMLEAVARLAASYDLPCQVSLEEYMACAVGGCAGCAVLLQTNEGPAMKRVCVDGPVFDAAEVFVATNRRS